MDTIKKSKSVLLLCFAVLTASSSSGCLSHARTDFVRPSCHVAPYLLRDLAVTTRRHSLRRFTMRNTAAFPYVAAVLSALCVSHVLGFTMERPLAKSHVSSSSLGLKREPLQSQLYSTSMQVKRDPIKMPSQTPMFPWKVR